MRSMTAGGTAQLASALLCPVSAKDLGIAARVRIRWRVPPLTTPGVGILHPYQEFVGMVESLVARLLRCW